MKKETIEIIRKCARELTYCWEDETANNWDLSCIDTAIKLLIQTVDKIEGSEHD